MRHLSAAVLIVFLVALPSCKFFKKFNKKDKALSELLAKQDSIRVADSLRIAQEKLLAIEAEKLESERKAEEERLSLENSFRYNIIVGSFITPEYAKKFVAAYQKEGYDPKIIKMEGSRFELVSAEAHDNFRKAVERLKAFQDTIEFEAWMYIKK